MKLLFNKLTETSYYSPKKSKDTKVNDLKNEDPYILAVSDQEKRDSKSNDDDDHGESNTTQFFEKEEIREEENTLLTVSLLTSEKSIGTSNNKKDPLPMPIPCPVLQHLSPRKKVLR